MAVKMHKDPYKTKQTLKGKGTPAGLRNISFMAEGGEVKSPEQIAKEAGFSMTPPSKPVIVGTMPPPKPVTTSLPPKTGMIGVRAARGGHVQGPGGPTDDKIPAMLSDGEYVLPAKTVAQVGVQNLDRMVEATNGKAPGARHGLRSGEHAIHAASGVYYVTPEGIASEDPNVGAYNRQATRMAASPQIAGTVPPSPAPAAPGVSPAPAQGTFGKIASGLRGFGGNLLKAAGPAIAGKAAVETGVTPTSEIDQRVQALGGPANASIERSIRESPVFRGAMQATPFVGPVLGAAANADPQLAADVITRGGGAIMSALGLNGTADRRVAVDGLRTPANVAMPSGTPPIAPTTPGADQTLRGSFVDPRYNAPVNRNGGEPELTNPSTNLDSEISKIGRNPFKGVNRSFYRGGQEQLASGIADELGQRAKVKALQDKYATDATIANSATANKLRTMELMQNQAEKNQQELKSMFDRTASVAGVDKDGNPTAPTVDPALRNRAEDFARSAVAGWDQLSPEQRVQGFEQVRHKFLLQELMNSGEANIMGKFMSGIGLADELGGYTAQPLKVKAVRTIGVGDLGQKASRLTSVVSDRPYVEFENGKLYPLADVVNTPELKGALESRIMQSSKSVQDQYKKYTSKGK